MKTKKIVTKIVTFMMAMCMLVGGFATVAHASAGYPWNRTLIYGQAFHIFADDQNDSRQYGDDIENNATLGTYSFTDPRTNKFRVRFEFRKSDMDRGPANSNVKVRIRATKPDGTLLFDRTQEPGSNGEGVFDSGFIYGVRVGEGVKIWVDISNATGYSGNGNFRAAYFKDFAIYYD